MVLGASRAADGDILYFVQFSCIENEVGSSSKHTTLGLAELTEHILVHISHLNYALPLICRLANCRCSHLIPRQGLD